MMMLCWSRIMIYRSTTTIIAKTTHLTIGMKAKLAKITIPIRDIE